MKAKRFSSQLCIWIGLLNLSFNCTLPKSIRLRLGTTLSWKGLKDSEIAAAKRYENLSPEQKLAIKERAKIMGEKLRDSKNTHTNIPTQQDYTQNIRINDTTMPSNTIQEGINQANNQNSWCWN